MDEGAPPAVILRGLVIQPETWAELDAIISRFGAWRGLDSEPAAYVLQ